MRGSSLFGKGEENRWKVGSPLMRRGREEGLSASVDAQEGIVTGPSRGVLWELANASECECGDH